MIERNWQELIRPEKPQIETGSDAQRKARLVAEPLERGFGTTLGFTDAGVGMVESSDTVMTFFST